VYVAQSFFVRVPAIGKYALSPLNGAPPEVIASRAFIGEARTGDEVFVLKLANPIYSSNVAQLRNEASALSRVSHPAVVRLHDEGEWELEFLTGEKKISPFVVIERCDTDLDLFLKSTEDEPGGMPLIRILADVAGGLAHLHSENIVHTDIRPENILLVETVGGWRARIADFGLAVTTEEQREAWQPTPLLNEYAPPDETIGSGYDVYSMGALAYKLFCHGSLFRRQFSLEKDFVWRSSVPGVARARLAQLIEAATEPDERHRDLSAADAASLLEEIAAGI
jgi:serine/threonine protein kinase